MNSIKCPECNLTNWATVAGCQRCGFLFQAVESENQLAEHAFGEQNYVDANQDSNYQKFQSPNYEPQSDWSLNQNYQQQDYRNNQQPNYQYNQPANLKTSLAIASMILGILGFVTSIFLIGILLAPIGLILGIVALVKANKKPEVYGGKGFAIAGIATSAIIVLFVPIIAAIAIPNLLAARRAANEAAAISSLRKLGGAESSFMGVKRNNGCGDLSALGSLNLIDPVLAKGEKSGYRFMVVNLPTGDCEIHAVPTSASTGARSFYLSTEDGVIRATKKDGKYADKNDLPLDDYAPDFSNQQPKMNKR